MKFFLRILHDSKYKTKLLASYLAVVLIPLAMWSIYSYYQTNAFLLEQAKINFRDIYTNTADNLNKKFSKVENDFSLITNDPSVGKIINSKYLSDYQKYYDITQKFDPMVNTLIMLNPEIIGVNIYTAGDIRSSRIQFMDLDEINKKSELMPILDSVATLWFMEDTRLFLAQRVLDINNPSQFAVVVLELDYNAIFNGNISDQIDNYGIIVADAAGKTGYHSNHLKHNLSSGVPSVSEIQNAYDSGKLFFQTSQLVPNGWKMHLYMDVNAILIPPQSALGSALIMISVSTILIFAVILVFSKSFVKRISKLNKYLSGIVKSEFKKDIQSDSKDEIGEITNSIGAMVKEARTLIEKVYESRIQQRESEIKALQAQINPHFLYNTLSAINWQAIKNDNEDISKIATALSTFYRSTLNKGNSTTTVYQEIETTKAYLDIQLNIHANSFDVTYQIDQSVLEYNMPSIILQPIVENAIEHGIDVKKDNSRGHIIIHTYEKGNDIIFEVIDNGPGISQEALDEVFVSSKKGYGVKNVNERLKLFFDQKYGLTFKHIDEGGTCAIIRIPKYVEL